MINGEKLSKERAKRGMTYVQLAEASGVDRSKIWLVENGRKGLSTDNFMKICRALNIDPRKVWED